MSTTPGSITGRRRAAGCAVGLIVGLAAGLAISASDRTRLRRAVYIDALTGLPNRAGWDRQAARKAAWAISSGGPAVVAALDVDRFKIVNDTWGHAAGDFLLRDLARRLSAIHPVPHLVARLGGDEFAVLLGPGNPRDLAARRDELRAQLCGPVWLRGCPVRMTVSVGVARLTHPAALESALAKADQAMYRARRSARAMGIYPPSNAERAMVDQPLLGGLR